MDTTTAVAVGFAVVISAAALVIVLALVKVVRAWRPPPGTPEPAPPVATSAPRVRLVLTPHPRPGHDSAVKPPWLRPGGQRAQALAWPPLEPEVPPLGGGDPQ